MNFKSPINSSSDDSQKDFFDKRNGVHPENLGQFDQGLQRGVSLFALLGGLHPFEAQFG